MSRRTEDEQPESTDATMEQPQQPPVITEENALPLPFQLQQQESEPGSLTKKAWAVIGYDHIEVDVPIDHPTEVISNTIGGELVIRDYVVESAQEAMNHTVLDVKDYDAATIRSVMMEKTAEYFGGSVKLGLNIANAHHGRHMFETGWVPVRPENVPVSAREGMIEGDIPGIGKCLLLNDTLLVAKPVQQAMKQEQISWARYNEALQETVELVTKHGTDEAKEALSKVMGDSNGEFSPSNIGNITFGSTTVQDEMGMDSTLHAMDGIISESQFTDHLATINREATRKSYGGFGGSEKYNKANFAGPKPNFGFQRPPDI